MVIPKVEEKIARRSSGLAYAQCFQFAKMFLPLNLYPKVNLLPLAIYW
ncbi:MAG: hypothetical protein ANABAC_2887 [Anaerolineae bacterium]|nr:MAG: hypothetical protein ANABAC_2887 [Anaerolineae bacterium]